MMTSPFCDRLSNRFFTIAFTLLASLAALPGRAASLAEQAHSLKQVPADSAFYSASLRMKEQWDSFVQSKAYERLMQVPVLQLGKMQATFYWQQSTDPTVVQLREYLESPAGDDAIVVLREMMSEEVFAYGGSDVIEWIKFAIELNSAGAKINLHRAQRAAEGAEDEDEAEESDDDDDKADSEGEGDENDQRPDPASDFLRKFTEKIKRELSVPTFVMGFRIKDTERAQRELDEVHSLLRNALDENQPEIAAKLARETVGRHEFLTLRLDGSMIPWEEIRNKENQEDGDASDDELFESLKKAVSGKTLVVALGVADEFVLLSIGSSTDHLEKMGQGATMATNPAVKRLEQHAGERIVSVGYLSNVVAQSLSSPQKTLDDLTNSIEQSMVAANIEEDDRKLILEDIRSLNLAKFMPEPGEVSSVQFLTSRGYQGYQYNTGKQPMLDSSKPLGILKHVGGNPLMVFASRSQQDLKVYEDLVEWLKRIGGHVEKIAEKKTDSEHWARYMEFRDRGVELLKRLDAVTREKLLPALADGQNALVIDTAATSRQWFDAMPEALKPLPMLEVAMVMNVSDPAKLREGVKTVIDVAADGYQLIREINPEEEMPEFRIPAPVVSDMDSGGKLYSFPLPKEWGVNSLIAVNAGLTDSVAAISLMPKTTERLVQEKDLGIDTVLPLDKPAATILHVNFTRFIEATRPWITYGMDVMTGKIKPKVEAEEGSEGEEPVPRQPPSAGMIQLGLFVPQFEQLLDVAAAFRSVTSVTYEEDGLWVTRSETHLEDLK